MPRYLNGVPTSSSSRTEARGNLAVAFGLLAVDMGVLSPGPQRPSLSPVSAE